MPVLDPGRAVHDITGANLLHELAPLLSETDTRDNGKALPNGVGMPSRSGARFEGD